MKLSGIIATSILALSACSPALAFSGATGSFTVHGTVTQVKPYYVTVEERIPNTSCGMVEVPIYKQGNGKNSGDAIIGAIIGGVIGNQFGKGDGNKAATAIGAAIGAVKGSQNGQNNNVEIIGYKSVEKCNTTYTTQQYEKVTGNQIVIEYAGGALKFRTDKLYNVGDKIPMNMELTVK